MMIDIYFFRHGETDYNVRHLLQGQCDRSARADISDQPLNKTGQAQAEKIAPLLKSRGVKLDAILSSDLRRAIETGQAVADAYGHIPLYTTPGLREIFFGPDHEGTVLDDFKALTFTPPLTFPSGDGGADLVAATGAELRALHKKTEPHYDLIAHPGGETKRAARDRALDALATFAQAHPDAHGIGVPSHNALLRFLMPDLTKVDHAECAHATFDASSRELKLIERLSPAG